ncbi:DISARM system SNF2-like helicase DrmD [Microbulbifer sp. HZ11]|uniref:DISARM system SNF2-like helicase DrmD n=1 Tax=Microbulbifer sp. HZ11 TaxID=1453501 RepID=UPI0005BA493B|nr:DISARM system SNF2-like helicase DrmD [Microbulbifer sp. HZ11]
MGATSAQVVSESFSNPPEPGQLVEVRRRQWIVADTTQSEDVALNGSRQHFVKLTSIDEDALREELEVVWEIEPGAHVIERKGLPAITGYDDSERLEAFLDAVRWGAATNADRGFLQAPFRSGVGIEDFQLDPLVRAIDLARANLLIADDVGLGKTIEAGLAIQELLLRHRARSVMVVCPASLQEKWRVEMLEKFGLEFKIVDTEYVKQLRRDRGIHANPWTSFPRLICSMDWMKAGEAMRLLRDILPVHPTFPRKFDILVVDEAHNIAPSGSGKYAVESQRTRLIRTIAPHFQHRLFLTATPHNGYTESFTSLLELLDDQRFARNVLPDEAQLAQVMIRRLKTDLEDKDGNPLYPKRKLKALGVDYTEQEREVHRLLQAYGEARMNSAQGSQARFGTKFINNLLKKRLFSSPAAFASTLEKHVNSIHSGPQDKKKDAIGDRILRKAIAKSQEDYADDQSYEMAQAEAVEEASRRVPPLTEQQSKFLAPMRAWAQTAMNQVDSKAQALLDWLESHLKENGKWNGKRVILFTEYRTTLDWLHNFLASHDFGGERLAILHGGVDHQDREVIKASFQAHPDQSEVRILLATDAASEGIDLQNHCNYLVHLEIPYNPNVMEQRNGRIDRHGQREKEVFIWHPVDADTSKGAIGGHADDILRALRKIDSMRQDLGSVNALIEPQISQVLEGTRNELETAVAEKKMASAKRYMRADARLKERIQKLHDRLIETREDFHLTPDRIQAAVDTALRLADKPRLKSIELAGAPSGTVFEMPPLSGTWARCAEGLEHPHTHKIRPITFDHEVAKGRDDVVLVHMNHRLVQMCLRLLRAEVWAQEDVKKLHRVAVKALPDDQLEGPAVVVLSRLVITGGNHHRLHEELIESGGFLSGDAFKREPRVGEVRRWLSESSPCRVSDATTAALKTRFDRVIGSVQSAVDSRANERLKSLANTLRIQQEKETKDINDVLDELERTISNELKAEKQPEQLGFTFEDLTEVERTQLKRDTQALEARLARIPEERENEVAAIARRFAEPSEHTFPVAVILLVPESLAEHVEQEQ